MVYDSEHVFISYWKNLFIMFIQFIVNFNDSIKMTGKTFLKVIFIIFVVLIALSVLIIIVNFIHNELNIEYYIEGGVKYWWYRDKSKVADSNSDVGNFLVKSIIFILVASPLAYDIYLLNIFYNLSVKASIIKGVLISLSRLLLSVVIGFFALFIISSIIIGLIKLIRKLKGNKKELNDKEYTAVYDVSLIPSLLILILCNYIPVIVGMSNGIKLF